MSTRTKLFGAVVSLGLAAAATADVLYEDVMYWMPDGSTQINPAAPPIDALVKIQETVYDDAQGKFILGQQLGNGLINGPGIPAPAINLYAYSITNLNYGNGAAGGSGVSGYHIPKVPGVIDLGQWAPNFANDRWSPATIPGWSWDMDDDADLALGDGLGILLGQTHNSFYFAVPDGTMHGFVDGAAIHTWSGGGAAEQPVAMDIGYIFGIVSAPIPTPGATGLLALGGLIAARRRR